MGMMSSAEAHDLRIRQAREKDRRPNILLIMTDQQRHDTLAAAGAHWMSTPRLDELAGRGCLYTRAFSNNPICMPARHTLLTGRPSRDHGYPDNVWGRGMSRPLPTFPRLLSDAGYETRSIGKNHFYPPRRHNGYLNMELMQEVPEYREQDEYLMALKEKGHGDVLNIHGVRNLLYMAPQRSLLPEDCHGTAWVADRAVDFIRTNKGRHPWLLTLGIIAPHPPFNVPPGYEHLYDGAPIPEPLVSRTSTSPLSAENRMLGDVPTPAMGRRMREAYCSLVSHVDFHVGRVLDALSETGLEENTLVIFTSDHGELLGDYGLYQKWLPYDSCARIPLVMRWPGHIEAGSRRDDFADLADLYPTILAAAGLEDPAPEELQGEDLLSPDPVKDRRRQFVEYSAGNRRWVSLRTGEWKYNWYFGGGREELFHITEDPGESDNLLESDPDSVREVKDELHHRLAADEELWGMPGSVRDGKLVILDELEVTPYRNRAFPVFQEKLTDPKEKAGMNSFLDEVSRAVNQEPTVNFRELDLETWITNGGFAEDEVESWIAVNEAENRTG